MARIRAILREGDDPEYLSFDSKTALDKSDSTWSTGITLKNVYWLPKAGRLIAEFYSIWDNGHGACKGTFWRDYTGDVEFCDKAGIDPETVGIFPKEVE